MHFSNKTSLHITILVDGKEKWIRGLGLAFVSTERDKKPRGDELLVTSTERTEEAKKYFQEKFVGLWSHRYGLKSAEFGVKKMNYYS